MSDPYPEYMKRPGVPAKKGILRWLGALLNVPRSYPLRDSDDEDDDDGKEAA